MTEIILTPNLVAGICARHLGKKELAFIEDVSAAEPDALTREMQLWRSHVFASEEAVALWVLDSCLAVRRGAALACQGNA